jgi:dienelactone hydrolase
MSLHCFSALALLVIGQAATVETSAPPARSPSEVKAAFTKRLDRPKVFRDILETSKQTKDGLTTEQFTIATEKKADQSIERMPVLMISPQANDQEAAQRRPVVIVLHGTGGNKEAMRGWLVDLAHRGIIGVAIDARYHGGRSVGAEKGVAYNAAITRAWRAGPDEPQEHPFYYDTCWDLWRLIDDLAARKDIDPEKIGMLGISMGGIETWLTASVDDRVAVAIPAISVQSFRWSLEHDQWQGRARTIAAAHQAAADDLGESDVNARVCRTLWNKVIPGILGPFDCPSMLRLFAGRPLMILNGEIDPNCPIGGAEVAFESAREAFREAGAADRLVIDVAKGSGHTVTPDQRKAALDWFVRWLKP